MNRLERSAAGRRPALFMTVLASIVSACGGGSGGVATSPPLPPPPPLVFGLDSRPDNQSCVAPSRPNADAEVSVTTPWPNLPAFSQPTKLLLEPVTEPRWFVLQKSGEVVVFDPDNATSVTTYLDLSATVRTDSEGGLLGLAFHPDYPNTPELFLSYTIDHSGPPMRSVVSRLILDNVTAPGAGTVEQVLLRVDQDFDNHNGGDIAFGPDGYLYIGLGDGGSGGDPNNRAQDTTTLLGSILRIDVTGAAVSFPVNPYDIPAGNPFAGNSLCGPGQNTGNCPEIYAWGFRNPWRWAFDPVADQLWVADVGQNAWEEINIVEPGGNFGWRCREGAHDFNTVGCGSGLRDPVSEYGRNLGNSVTGGQVYHGTALPELIGRYIFGDFGSGRIWALQQDGQGGFINDEITDTNDAPTSFASAADGEVYFTDFNSGQIRMIAPSTAPAPDTVQSLLSATGCTDSADTTRPYAGLVPYEINAPFWSDGAIKDRYIGLPNGTTISMDAEGDWIFPNGTILVKNFRLDGNLIETRHLMRHPDGVWAGYTYEWNAQQTDAVRVQGGKTVNIGGQAWRFPSENQCMQCHTVAAGFSLGPETAQLNGDLQYPSTMRIANQLETLDHIMMFASPLSGSVDILPSLADPADANASLDDRARAYLHTNCAQCHRPGGQTLSPIDFRFSTPLSATNVCDVIPTEGDFGIANARLIAPGAPERSIIIERASRRDTFQMPPTGSNLVDTEGMTLLTNWIAGLPNCN